MDEEHIYPGVDLGVADLLEDESLLIMGNVAGTPQPFGHNWTGREGPFVPIVGLPLLNRMAGKPSRCSPDGTFAFFIPDLKK